VCLYPLFSSQSSNNFVVIVQANTCKCDRGDYRRYLAPEYLNTGHQSTKADVFSFGVLIFETISGYRIYEHTPSRDITILEDVSTISQFPVIRFHDLRRVLLQTCFC